METRRSFLRKGIIAGIALMIPGCLSRCAREAKPLKRKDPRRGLVMWYSQTGHTERHGRLIAKCWEKEGLQVDTGDYRKIDVSKLSVYDIIAIGTPVFYYDTPVNVREWIKKLPCLDGTAVAAFVTFGGPEGNQHNAATTLLELFADRGGVPVDLGSFMNMSSFPVAEWDGKGQREHRHLPDEKTYESVRLFARRSLEKTRKGEAMETDRWVTLREIAAYFPAAGATKLFYRNHQIDRKKCIQCGTCTDKCPAGAIDISTFSVNRSACVLCFGCFNNCPVQAVQMEASGKKLYNFPEFLKRNGITIKEPPELALADNDKNGRKS